MMWNCWSRSVVLGVAGMLSLAEACALGQEANPRVGNGAGATAPKVEERPIKKDESKELSPEAEAALLKQGECQFDAHVPALLKVKRAPTGHLLVRPKINGEEPGWFIFDTGAGVCVISTPKVEGLHLRAAGEIPAVGVGGSQGAPLYRADALVLGPMTSHDHPFMATDLSFLKTYLGDEIAGVIGYGVLSKSVSEISIGSASEPGRVALFDPATFDLAREHASEVQAGTTWAKLRIVERIPAIQGQIEDHDAWFRIDTGANGYVTLHASAVEKWKLLEGRETAEAKLGGVGGFVQGRRGTLRSIEVAGVRLDNVSATFALEKKGSFANDAFDANLGAEMIRSCVVVLDYGHERAAFLPKAPAKPEGGPPKLPAADSTPATR